MSTVTNSNKRNLNELYNGNSNGNDNYASNDNHGGGNDLDNLMNDDGASTHSHSNNNNNNDNNSQDGSNHLVKQEDYDNNNGTINEHNHNNENNSLMAQQEVKKTRLDQSSKQDPSRVLHIRGIPQQLTDNEIIYLGLYFGQVKNVLFLRSKFQAFLEFQTLDDAKKMIDYFGQNQTLTFYSKKLFIQYSNHQELNTDPNNSSNQIAQAALNEATQLHLSSKQGGKNCVLRVTVLNMMFPVTLDVLNSIFTKYGPILKIITFTKNDKFQALIQMKDALSAQNAKTQLNGQNIYNGCCQLQIDYSKLNALEVKYNNEKSKDLTNLLLPSGENSNSNNNAENGLQGPQPNGGGPNASIPGGNNNHNNTNNNNFNFAGLLNNSNNLFNAVSQFALNNFQNMASSFGNNSQMSSSGNNPRHQQNGNDSSMTSPVLLVTNLNEQFVTPEALFTLFGVYGDVVRVKVLFNKKDSALINFVNGQHAATALNNLDRIKLWNKQIRVFPSKHLTVQMPKDGQPDAGLTKDFTSSPLHRFKKPGSKNFNNIFPPSPTLHLSNIPQEIEEKDLRDLFGQYGQIKGFRFFQKDRKMALIQMTSIEESITALIATHNHQLADNMHLRVAFSKATA